MEHDTARGLYKEVCIKFMFGWLALAHSGNCLKAWENNLGFMQTPSLAQFTLYWSKNRDAQRSEAFPYH